MLRDANSGTSRDDRRARRNVEGGDDSAPGAAGVDEIIRIIRGERDHRIPERSHDTGHNLRTLSCGTQSGEKRRDLHARRLASHHDVERRPGVLGSHRLPKGELLNRALKRVQWQGAHLSSLTEKRLALST